MRDLAADPLSLWYPIAISILQNWLPNTQFEETAYGSASIATLCSYSPRSLRACFVTQARIASAVISFRSSHC